MMHTEPAFYFSQAERSLSAMHRTTFSERAQETIDEIIRTRRTIHLFKSSPTPSQEEVLHAVDLARWAPNHFLTEPWRFYLLGRETAEAIARLNASLVAETRGEAAGQAKLDRWLEIPGWLVVTCAISEDDRRQQEDYAACCCAVQNLQLVLWSRGIGTKWTTGDVTKSPEFFRIVGIDPAAVRLVSMLWYGYPAEVPRPPRKPVREILERRP